MIYSSTGTNSGPSPRTWGEQPEARLGPDVSRTIPTHVGRTRTLASLSAWAPDHPHARGENISQLR